jgi:hypothetical protein
MKKKNRRPNRSILKKEDYVCGFNKIGEHIKPKVPTIDDASLHFFFEPNFHQMKYNIALGVESQMKLN